MKRYKRRNPLIPLQKMVVVILCVALAAVLAWLLTGESAGTVACCGVLAALVVAYLFVAAGAAHRYAYCGDHIKLLYLMIPYQKYRYDAASSICISNAAYNNGYGYGPNGSIPMQYKSGGKKGLTTVFPFITLHGKVFPIHRIHAGMTSREIFMLAGEKSFCLGICWFDSLEELLAHTDVPVHVLEDVYIRFKGKFDQVFTQQENRADRVYTVTDHEIGYLRYLAGERQSM